MVLQAHGNIIEQGGGTNEVVGEGGDEEGEAGFFKEQAVRLWGREGVGCQWGGRGLKEAKTSKGV